MKRTLTLKREPIADLTRDELASVVAAEALPSGLTCPIRDCFVDSNLGMCWTWVC